MVRFCVRIALRLLDQAKICDTHGLAGVISELVSPTL